MDWPVALAQHARHHLGIRATGTDVGWYQHGWNVLQTILEELRFALIAVIHGTAANAQNAPAQLVLGLGNKLVYNSGSSGFERDGKLDLRVLGEVDRGDESTKEESIGDTLKKATSLAEAAAAVELSLRKQIAISIGVYSDEVDVQRPLSEFGGKYWFAMMSCQPRTDWM
ncbi:Beta-ketoacyl synthase [Metarhizium robertsii ARSEF 23]|uniref:Beta-ketoacyl synthase n=1 Tax=Metarhizium robertsii (strain ARSEF 23 / ATCC MYA-3075) TaxID=655844 RepID=E9FDX6_METRA|nr:Beta-ketoacyl synthase [Metarhizium robertsii ARSEF 23]EFY94057.2 Beta-ketoacyl synthase [Metarhizium robertsii ARSEF 23]